MEDARPEFARFLLDPVGETEVEASAVARRLDSLRGKASALVDSTKPHADAVLEVVREGLEAAGAARFVSVVKPRLSSPVPAGLLESAAQADGAVLATFD